MENKRLCENEEEEEGGGRTICSTTGNFFATYAFTLAFPRSIHRLG